jgi:hypothetical protein
MGALSRVTVFHPVGRWWPVPVTVCCASSGERILFEIRIEDRTCCCTTGGRTYATPFRSLSYLGSADHGRCGRFHWNRFASVGSPFEPVRLRTSLPSLFVRPLGGNPRVSRGERVPAAGRFELAVLVDSDRSRPAYTEGPIAVGGDPPGSDVGREAAEPNETVLEPIGATRSALPARSSLRCGRVS